MTDPNVVPVWTCRKCRWLLYWDSDETLPKCSRCGEWDWESPLLNPVNARPPQQDARGKADVIVIKSPPTGEAQLFALEVWGLIEEMQQTGSSLELNWGEDTGLGLWEAVGSWVASVSRQMTSTCR